MWNLTKENLQEIKVEFGISNIDFRIFVETGTHYADTIKHLLNEFDEIHSVELSIPFYQRAVSIFTDESKVNLYQGDSTYVLPLIIKKINSPCIFFLDGHFSDGDTARGEKDVPILEELESIVSDFESECLIIIDDLRLFGTSDNQDWSYVTEDSVFEIVGNRLEKHSIIKDRLILKIKSKS